MPMRPLNNLRVVVIGGGICGCSVALHLTELGVQHVTLLESVTVGAGSTARSAGLMEAYCVDALTQRMAGYAARFYPRIAVESGVDVGWRAVGRVIYTAREDHWERMRGLPDQARARGIDVELLSPGAVAARLPIIAAEGLLGGLWMPGDAYVATERAVIALARLARAQGATIREHTRVLGISAEHGAIRGVLTQEGELHCDVIVVAAGLWSAELVQSCGLRLPLQALQQQYLLTQPLGLAAGLPVFHSDDDQLYGRQENGALLIGCLDDNAPPLPAAALQADSIARLSPRWARFEPYMKTALRRFPVLRAAPVEQLVNGAESYTADGKMLLGPVPGVSGLYTACGLNLAGTALGPAAGRFLATWIVDGAPSQDLAALDVRRFSPAQSAAAYIRERVQEIASLRCRIVAPDDDYRTARDIFRSPLHDRLAEAGARFASVNAWERALWLKHGSGDSSWGDAVAKEVRAATSGVLVVDRSADTKFLLAGTGATAWFEAHAPTGFDDGQLRAGNDTVDIRPVWGTEGFVEALVRTLAHGPDWCHLSTSPDQEMRLTEWLRRAQPPPEIQVHDETAAYACLELYGPQRGSLIRALSAGSDDSPVAYATHARWAGGAQFHVRKDAFNDSTILTVPAPSATHVWSRLVAAGRDFDLAIGGHFAEEALRIARGVPLFGREITLSTSIAALRAMMARHPESGESSASRGIPGLRTFGAFSSPMTTLEFGSHDAILAGERTIGLLTSRLRLPGWAETLALGLLDFSLWDGEPLHIVVGGRSWPLALREIPWQVARRAHTMGP